MKKYDVMYCSLFVFSILFGILAPILSIASKGLLIKPFLYTTGLFIALKIIILIVSFILNKKTDTEIDHERRLIFTTIYIVTQIVVYFIGLYIESKSLSDWWLILIFALIYNFISLIDYAAGDGIDTTYIPSTNPKNIRVEKDIFGDTVYKDDSGKVIARGEKNIFGDEVIKDTSGKVVAESRTNDFTKEKVYVDKNLNTIARKDKNIFGDDVIKDKKGKVIYEKEKSIFGSKLKKK